MQRLAYLLLLPLLISSCIAQKLSHPESVAYDSVANAWFVSNPGSKSLARIDSNGITTIIATGLSIPLGLVIHEGNLWLADSASLKCFGFDGTLSDRIDIPNAQQLNGIITGPDGTLMVSDRRGDAILRVDTRTRIYDTLLSGSIHIPNGLALLDEKTLIVVNSTDSASLYLVNIDDGRIIQEFPSFRAYLDGVTHFIGDYYIVSSWGKDWKDPALLLFNLRSSEPAKVIQKRDDAPADIHYFPEKGQLAIPAYYGNSLVIIPFDELFKLCFLN